MNMNVELRPKQNRYLGSGMVERRVTFQDEEVR